MKFFSIAIPTYEMSGKGAEYLEYNLNKIHHQSFRDFEIVISDHSKDDSIKDLCDKWTSLLDIKYFRNKIDIGSSSSNINNAISKSKGRYIKIIFQDDFLYDYDSLKNTNDTISKNPNSNWFVSKCQHSNDGIVFYRENTPSWNDGMLFGNNTISSPSVLTIKNDDSKILFDKEYTWLMDCDYYQRCYNKFGLPTIIPFVTIVNRTWENQLTNKISTERKEYEHFHILKKHNFMINTELVYYNLCSLNYPISDLYSRGIVDINEHLPTLRKLSEQCDHVTEMGTRKAISTLSLLIGKPKKVVSIDLNYHFFKPYEEETKFFAECCKTNFQFIEADVLKIDIEKTDMLFIDTLHTYNQLSKELRKHEKNVKKWIVLHDTVTFGERDEDFYQNGIVSDEVKNDPISKRGLYNALVDFLEENKNWRIKEHYTNNNGLTIIERV